MPEAGRATNLNQHRHIKETDMDTNDEKLDDILEELREQSLLLENLTSLLVDAERVQGRL